MQLNSHAKFISNAIIFSFVFVLRLLCYIWCRHIHKMFQMLQAVLCHKHKLQ